MLGGTTGTNNNTSTNEQQLKEHSKKGKNLSCRNHFFWKSFELLKMGCFRSKKQV